MDANENVGNIHITNRFEAVGLKEAILDKHREKEGIQPTYQRGREPIDGIFISHNLEIEEAGYLPFGEGPSDHRGLWIKIKEDDIFDYSMGKVTPPSARRLTLDNPRVTKKWVNIYKEFLLEHNLFERIFYIQNEISTNEWRPELAIEYERIRQLRLQGIKLADSKCRKLNMGEVPWSMTLQAARDTIELWSNMVSRKRGTKVSTRYISRLEKTTGINHALQINLQEASTRLTESYKRYYELKLIAHELRESWLMELAAIKAKEYGGDQFTYYNNLTLQERERLASRRMKRILGKLNGHGLTQAIVTQEDGSILDFTAKEDIEQACLEEN